MVYFTKSIALVLAFVAASVFASPISDAEVNASNASEVIDKRDNNVRMTWFNAGV
jgi:hypothetical protein